MDVVPLNSSNTEGACSRLLSTAPRFAGDSIPIHL